MKNSISTLKVADFSIGTLNGIDIDCLKLMNTESLYMYLQEPLPTIQSICLPAMYHPTVIKGHDLSWSQSMV